MYRLVDVAVATLGRDANYASDARNAIALIKRWPQLMGPEHPLERDLEGNPVGWFVYAYTVMKYAVDHFPNPTAPASLRQSRETLLQWGSQPATGGHPFKLLAKAAPGILRLLGPSRADSSPGKKTVKRSLAGGLKRTRTGAKKKAGVERAAKKSGARTRKNGA